MTQSVLSFESPAPLQELLEKKSRCARVAQQLVWRRGIWIDGLVLAEVGGAYAWRSRVAELRKAPWHLTVENRQRRLESGAVVSEYRVV